MAATAAQRTFTIPELEQILVQLVEHPPIASYSTSRTSQYLEMARRIKELYVLRRVDCAFNNATKSSKQLRHWMCFGPVSSQFALEDLDFPISSPMCWLFARMGLKAQSTYFEESPVVKKVIVLYFRPGESGKSLPRGFSRSRRRTRIFARAESSWRNINIFTGDYNDLAVIHIDVDLGRHGYECHREDNPTLGTVYDRIRMLYEQRYVKGTEQQIVL